MFENLSASEKRMAVIVAVLLPLALVFFGWTSLMSSFTEKDQQIQRLTKQNQDLNRVKLESDWAANRKAIYQQESLPTNQAKSKLQYQQWLEMTAESLGMAANVTPPGRPSSIDGSVFGQAGKHLQFKYQFASICDVNQLTMFLYKLKQTKIMHRLSRFSIKPVTEGNGDDVLPTGELAVSLDVDVACIEGAAEEREFDSEVREDMDRTLEEYRATVCARDLFGLPNSAPEFDDDDSFDYEIGDRIRDISVSASDDDDNQQLTYELLDSDIEEAVIDPETGSIELGDGKWEEEGRHRLVVQVRDTGWPSKTDKITVTINIDEVEIEEEIAERLEAKDTIVGTGETVVRGVRKIWIYIGSQSRTERMAVGSSFELDGKTWTIHAIDDELVTIDCDGKLLKYRRRSKLSDPQPDDNVSLND